MQDNSKLRGYAKQYHKEISDLLRRMPRELLLLLKANDCLRSIDVVLGRPLNTIAITARACSRAAREGSAVEASAGDASVNEAARTALRRGLVDSHVNSQQLQAHTSPAEDTSSKSYALEEQQSKSRNRCSRCFVFFRTAC